MEHVEDASDACLFVRLGGRPNLERIVYELYDLMRFDSLLGPQFERFARTDSTFLRLKIRTVDFLEWLLGGPYVYDGPDLFVAHASMHIDNLSYTQMMKLYQQVLVGIEDIDELSKQELLQVLEAQRGPVVDPYKEFEREHEERWQRLKEEREIREKKFGKKKFKSFETRILEQERAKGNPPAQDFLEVMARTAGLSDVSLHRPASVRQAGSPPLASSEVPKRTKHKKKTSPHGAETCATVDFTPCTDEVKQLSHRFSELLPRLGALPARRLLQLTVQPPPSDRLEDAVCTLVELGALTSRRDEQARITILGRMAIVLPLDLRLCRLVLFGALFGCAADAVVMAAALSGQDPFSSPMHMVIKDHLKYARALAKSFESRWHFDGGSLSEPIMLRNLFKAWLKGLSQEGEGTLGSRLRVQLGASQRSMLLKHSQEFAKDHSVMPKRLTHLALTVVEIAQRTLEFLAPNTPEPTDGHLPSPSRRRLEALLAALGVQPPLLVKDANAAAEPQPLFDRVGILGVPVARTPRDLLEDRVQELQKPLRRLATGNFEVVVKSALTGEVLSVEAVDCITTALELSLVIQAQHRLACRPMLLLDDEVLNPLHRLEQVGVQSGSQLSAVITEPAAFCVAGLPEVGLGEHKALCKDLNHLLRYYIHTTPPVAPYLPCLPSGRTQSFIIVTLSDSNEVQHVVRNIHGKVATLSGTTNALMAFELGEAETLLQEGVHEAAILRAITEEARAWRQAAESKPC
eukprot:s14_g12.t1